MCVCVWAGPMFLFFVRDVRRDVHVHLGYVDRWEALTQRIRTRGYGIPIRIAAVNDREAGGSAARSFGRCLPPDLPERHRNHQNCFWEKADWSNTFGNNLPK